MAEMDIIANVSNVSIDNFLMDNDSDIQVSFDFGSWVDYWVGYMLQDDYQESWVNTNHIITIRASEGLGRLKDVQLNSGGAELIGKYTPLDIIDICTTNSVQSFAKYTCINNLFHSSMTDTSTYTGLDQCYVDAKTFQQNVDIYDSCYTVIEKINNAWNQTMFMYKGHWFILRLEELWIDGASNLRGYSYNLGTRTLINRRYDIQVGVGENVKPISPEMLRFIKRRTKKDIITFNYDQFEEVVCNESFQRGSTISTSATVNVYNLDNWTRQMLPLSSPATPTNGDKGRKVIFDANGQIIDNYAYCDDNMPSTADATWLRSCNIYVRQYDKFDISFDIRQTTAYTAYIEAVVAIVQLYVGTNKYFLKKDGTWQLVPSWGSMYVLDACTINYSSSAIFTEWQTYNLTSFEIPGDGYINILLWNYQIGTTNQSQFKNLKVNIINSFNGITNRNITGVQSIYEKSNTLTNTFEDTIYLDDNVSQNYKGTIFESNALTLTGPEWHRYRYNTESFGFRHQNDIAHWAHNRYNRNKIDANFYGLTFNGGTEPIGLMNTIKFVDDDPNRIYYIINMKEIDFSNSTWSATLEEVFNSDYDETGGSVTHILDTTATSGSYSSITKAPLTVVSLADFTINGASDQLTYNGASSITVNLVADLQGFITSYSSTPCTIYLKKNTTTIASQSFTPSTAFYPFSAYLNASSITLNVGDTLHIEIQSNITSLVITGGGIDTTYTTTDPVTYGTYSDKFIYQ